MKKAETTSRQEYIWTRKVVPLYTENGVIWSINDGNLDKIAKSENVFSTDINQKQLQVME